MAANSASLHRGVHMANELLSAVKELLQTSLAVNSILKLFKVHFPTSFLAFRKIIQELDALKKVRDVWACAQFNLEWRLGGKIVSYTETIVLLNHGK